MLSQHPESQVHIIHSIPLGDRLIQFGLPASEPAGFEIEFDPITRDAAVYSADRRYRYLLTRVWNPSGETVLWVLLNPSTASAFENDPTIRRCIYRFSKQSPLSREPFPGVGSLIICNAFGFRATDPVDMLNQVDPVGFLNDFFIQLATGYASYTFAGWGNLGSHMGRDQEIRRILPGPVWCVGHTQSGQPRHPLYVASAQKAVLHWEQPISVDNPHSMK